MGIRSVPQSSEIPLRSCDLIVIHSSNISIGQAPDSGLWDQYMPFYDVYSPDLRCGRGAATSGPGTKTATVLAGDEVGLVVGRSADEVHTSPMRAVQSHQDPASRFKLLMLRFLSLCNLL
jgi:hypothetical protein